jgi:hypothetical protein
MTVGQGTGWVQWLPGGTRLVVLANRNDAVTCMVTAATLAALPVRFTGSGQGRQRLRGAHHATPLIAGEHSGVAAAAPRASTQPLR